MEADIQVGFEDFARKAAAKYEPLLRLAGEFLTLAHGMLQPPTADPLTSLLRSICLIIANSYQSVLLLTIHGCGSDALKIVRSMFESTVAASYLQENPGLLQDFLDYRWVKRNKHQEFLAQFAPDKLKLLDPAEVTKTVVEYARVKAKFKGRKSWSDKSLPKMANDVGLAQQYLAIYPFTSSIHHLDVIGIMAQQDNCILDIEVLPSHANIGHALSISGMTAYSALYRFDQAVGGGKAAELEDWFKRYGDAQDPVRGRIREAPLS